MPLYRNHGGTWMPVVNVYRHNGGGWQQVKNAWRHNGSGWVQFYTSRTFSPGFSVDHSPGSGTASAGIQFHADGTRSLNVGNTGTSGNWTTPTAGGVGNSYWIRMVPSYGSFTSGTVNTWLQLNTSRFWGIVTAFGSHSCGGTVQLSADAGNSIMSSASFAMSAEGGGV